MQAESVQNVLAKLPESIRFGTSSWTYRGWQDLVYKQSYRSEREFKRCCLGEYARYPWFRTVGIDSTFYSPPSVRTIEAICEQLPSSFCWTEKVWEEITVLEFPSHPRYGARKATKNSRFLDADAFAEAVLKPHEIAKTAARVHAFVFQFPYFAQTQIPSGQHFAQRLNSFLERLPKGFSYAVEIRNKSFLCPEYFQALNDNEATHCFNHWSYMPRLSTQMRAAAEAGGLRAPFFVARLLTPLGVSYAQAVKRFAPYDHLQEELSDMRQDVLRLLARALDRAVRASIIVNNRLEGCAPLTIEAIMRRAAETIE